MLDIERVMCEDVICCTLQRRHVLITNSIRASNLNSKEHVRTLSIISPLRLPVWSLWRPVFSLSLRKGLREMQVALWVLGGEEG